MAKRSNVWTGAPYGYTKVKGNPEMWRSAFDDALHEMGIDEAQRLIDKDDPWTILGVRASQAADEIKAAFRKLALRHHPDKNPGDPTAGDRFRRILAAYKLVEPHLK